MRGIRTYQVNEMVGRLHQLSLFILLLGASVCAACGTTGSLTGIPPVGDTTAPTVTAIVPSSESIVPAEAYISVTFSKPMNTRSIAITAQPQIAFGPAEWSADERTVSFKPQALLSLGTRYTIGVSGKDKAGNALPPFTWSFAAGPSGGRSGAGAARLIDRVEALADPRVFTLFLALTAAGHDRGANASGIVREMVRRAVDDLAPDVVEPFRRYRIDHPQGVEEYVRYVLSLSDPPEFAERRASGGLERLNRVLAGFYDAANVPALWSTHRTAYEAAAAALVGRAPGAIGQVFDYARAPDVSDRIVVIPNLLDDASAAYLIPQPQAVFFVVGWRGPDDTLGLMHLAARLLLDRRLDAAAAELRRTDPLFPLVRETAARWEWTSWEHVVRESLAAAVTARLALKETARAEYLRGQYGRGLILVDHFTRELVRYERSSAPLAEFVTELLRTVNLGEEQRAFSTRRP